VTEPSNKNYKEMVNARHLSDWKKKELEKKKIQKIHTLRKYAKLLKKENITDSDRIKLKGNDTERLNSEGLTGNTNSRQKDTRKPKPLSHQTPLTSEATLSEKRQEEREQREKERQKEIEEANRRRKKERKLLSLKTSKGQPVLKGHIQKLLGKLQKEQVQGSK
jgi:hypothetical protein